MARKTSDVSGIEFEESSGNVFADIGFDRKTAQKLAFKADLVGVLRRALREQGLTQLELSRRVGIPQPRLSSLFAGKIAGMSTDKLIDAVTRLGAHITIRVDEHPVAAQAGMVELEVA